MAETKKSETPISVQAAIEPATREGFALLMQRANSFLAVPENAQYRLLTVVRLEKAVAAVFVRNVPKGTTTEFWEEDDVTP